MPQKQNINYLMTKYTTNVAQAIHFRINNNKQTKTKENNRFFRCHKKKQINYLIIKYIINIARNNHFRVNKTKTKKNEEKHRKTNKNTTTQKFKKCDLKKAHHKKDLLARS